jgi:hypothetical protein
MLSLGLRSYLSSNATLRECHLLWWDFGFSLTASMKMTVFYDVAPKRLVKVYRQAMWPVSIAHHLFPLSLCAMTGLLLYSLPIFIWKLNNIIITYKKFEASTALDHSNTPDTVSNHTRDTGFFHSVVLSCVDRSLTTGKYLVQAVQSASSHAKCLQKS